MQIEQLTGVWVVIRSDGSPVTSTISVNKHFSILAFCHPTEWSKWEEKKYQCIQVDIEFKPTKQ